MKRYQPMQPIEYDGAGVIRFRRNAIVRWLLDNGGKDLNDLCRVEFPPEDREQFMQLIGYSVANVPDQSPETLGTADKLSELLCNAGEVPMPPPGYDEGYRDGYAEGRAEAFGDVATYVQEQLGEEEDGGDEGEQP